MKSDAKLKIRRFLEQANWHISGRIVVGVGEGASDDLFSLCSKRRFKQATNIRLTLPGGNYVRQVCNFTRDPRERDNKSVDGAGKWHFKNQLYSVRASLLDVVGRSWGS